MDSAIVEHAEPRPAHVENAVAISYSTVDSESAHYGYAFETLGLADTLWFAPGFEVGLGMRAGSSENLKHGYAVEGFTTLSIAPHFRTLYDAAGRTAFWSPAVGIELGLSSAERQFRANQAPESASRTDGPAGAAYAMFLARPVRFRFANFTVTAFGLGFGSPLRDPGAKLRVQLDLLQIALVL